MCAAGADSKTLLPGDEIIQFSFLDTPHNTISNTKERELDCVPCAWPYYAVGGQSLAVLFVLTYPLIVIKAITIRDNFDVCILWRANALRMATRKELSYIHSQWHLESNCTFYEDLTMVIGNSVTLVFNPEKSANSRSVPRRDRVRDFFVFFFFPRIRTYARLSVPVSLSCEQHILRPLCTLKIPKTIRWQKARCLVDNRRPKRPLMRTAHIYPQRRNRVIRIVAVVATSY